MDTFNDLKQWLLKMASIGFGVGVVLMGAVYGIPYFLGGPCYPCRLCGVYKGECALDRKFSCATDLSTLWPWEFFEIGLPILLLALILRSRTTHTKALKAAASVLAIVGSIVLSFAGLSAVLRYESHITFVDENGRETSVEWRPSFIATAQCIISGDVPPYS